MSVARSKERHEKIIDRHTGQPFCPWDQEEWPCEPAVLLDRIAVMERVLESARHALVTTHNLYATDMPDEYGRCLAEGCTPVEAYRRHRAVSWFIDNNPVLAMIDDVLGPIARPAEEAP